MSDETAHDAWFLAHAEAYLCDGLDACEQARFEAHLAAHPQAQAHLDALRQDDARLRQLLSQEGPDPMFEQALIADFRNRTLPVRLMHPLVRRAATATAAAIVLAAVGFGTQHALQHDGLPSPSGEWFSFRSDTAPVPPEQPAAAQTQDAPTTRPATQPWARASEDPSARPKTVDELLQTSRRLIDQKDYEKAATVLDQVLQLDPRNEHASSALPLVQDQSSIQNQRRYREQALDQLELQLNNNQEKLIPYDDVFRYPDNWPELSRKRESLVPRDLDGDGITDMSSGRGANTNGGITGKGNSQVTTSDGQNVFFGDGHVEYYGGVRVRDGGTLMLGGQALNGTDGSDLGDDAKTYTVTNGRMSEQSNQLGKDYFKPTQLAQATAPDDRDVRDGKKTAEAGPAANEQPAQPAKPQAPANAPADRPVPAQPPASEQVAPRKVIRNGVVEFEIDSFDSASATITKIVVEDGGYVSSTDAEKLANGKVRGTMVVRVAPDRLDTFMLKLRGLGDLKSQKITASDVTKHYVDLESELRAARAMEKRLLGIIESGRGEIKDLLEAEKQLGEWRTKIEKLEGERRYIDNQVAMSTLSITLQERDIRAASALVESEQVSASIETEQVEEAYAKAKEAVAQFKGRIIESELKQYDAGQLGAKIVAEIPGDQTDGLVARVKQIGGRMASFNRERRQAAEDGSAKTVAVARVEQRPTRVALTIYNLANVAPRRTTSLTLAAADLDAAYEAIAAEVRRAGGRVVTGQINRAQPQETTAVVDLEVPEDASPAAVKAIAALGETMRSGVATSSDTANTTAAKHGIKLNLLTLASVAPRETVSLSVAAGDPSAAYRKVLAMLKDEKTAARLLQTQLSQQNVSSASGVLDFEIRREHEQALWELVKGAATIVMQSSARADASADATDSKLRVRMQFVDVDRVPPRQMTTMAAEVGDVEKVGGALQAAATGAGGKTVDWQLSKQRDGRNSARLVIEVPQAQAQGLLKQIADAGTVRSIESTKNEQVPDGAVARTRIELSLSNADRLVAGDQGILASLRTGLATSIRALLWSLQLILIGVLVLGPWALLFWAGFRLWKRRRRATVQN